LEKKIAPVDALEFERRGRMAGAAIATATVGSDLVIHDLCSRLRPQIPEGFQPADRVFIIRRRAGQSFSRRRGNATCFCGGEPRTTPNTRTGFHAKTPGREDREKKSVGEAIGHPPRDSFDSRLGLIGLRQRKLTKGGVKGWRNSWP